MVSCPGLFSYKSFSRSNINYCPLEFKVSVGKYYDFAVFLIPPRSRLQNFFLVPSVGGLWVVVVNWPMYNWKENNFNTSVINVIEDLKKKVVRISRSVRTSNTINSVRCRVIDSNKNSKKMIIIKKKNKNTKLRMLKYAPILPAAFGKVIGRSQKEAYQFGGTKPDCIVVANID